MANRNDNGQVLTMDMVKFADAARESFDKDGKTGLNKSEFAGLTNIFGVDEKLKSDLMFDILDRNGDNTIDTVELGALFMYMDQAKGEYGDGDITHDEMKTAIDKFFKNPADAGQFFDSAISESPLKARYKTFLEGKK
jgi:hypothetical protein